MIFQAIQNKPLCPNCEKAENDAFERAKAYLRENGHASVKDVCDNCEVTMNQIKRWLREERLEFGTGISTGLTCDKCGKPVNFGKFCPECKEALQSAFGIAGRSMGMRFIKN